MPAEETRTAVKQLGYNIVGSSNSLASFEDITVILSYLYLFEWLDGRPKIVILARHHYSLFCAVLFTAKYN